MGAPMSAAGGGGGGDDGSSVGTVEAVCSVALTTPEALDKHSFATAAFAAAVEEAVANGTAKPSATTGTDVRVLAFHPRLPVLVACDSEQNLAAWRVGAADGAHGLIGAVRTTNACADLVLDPALPLLLELHPVSPYFSARVLTKSLPPISFALPATLTAWCASNAAAMRPVSILRRSTAHASWVAWNGSQAAVLVRSVPSAVASAVFSSSTSSTAAPPWSSLHALPLAAASPPEGLHTRARGNAFYVQSRCACLPPPGGVKVRLSLQHRSIPLCSAGTTQLRSRRIAWLPHKGDTGPVRPVRLDVALQRDGGAAVTWVLVKYNNVQCMAMAGSPQPYVIVGPIPDTALASDSSAATAGAAKQERAAVPVGKLQQAHDVLLEAATSRLLLLVAGQLRVVQLHPTARPTVVATVTLPMGPLQMLSTPFEAPAGVDDSVAPGGRIMVWLADTQHGRRLLFDKAAWQHVGGTADATDPLYVALRPSEAVLSYAWQPRSTALGVDKDDGGGSGGAGAQPMLAVLTSARLLLLSTSLEVIGSVPAHDGGDARHSHDPWQRVMSCAWVGAALLFTCTSGAVAYMTAKGRVRRLCSLDAGAEDATLVGVTPSALTFAHTHWFSSRTQLRTRMVPGLEPYICGYLDQRAVQQDRLRRKLSPKHDKSEFQSQVAALAQRDAAFFRLLQASRAPIATRTVVEAFVDAGA